MTTPATSADWETIGYHSRIVGDQFIYLDRPTTTGSIEMYTRAPDGSDTPQKFNIPLPTSNWDVLFWSRTTDPSKLFVSIGRNGPEKHYWANPDDPTDVELIDPIMPSGASEIIAMNSTNDYGLVQRYYGSVGEFGLSSVSLTGGQPVHHYVPPDTHSGFQTYRLSPDGQTVTYFVSQFSAPYSRLFSSSLNGSSPPVELFNNGSLPTASYNHHISNDSAYVLYTPGDGLYSVPIAGGTAIQLSPALVPGATLTSFRPIADRAFFAGNFNLDDKRELYTAPIDGSATAVRLNGDMIDTGDVGSYTPMTIGGIHYAMFTADATVDGRIDLFARKYDGSGPLIEFGDLSKHGSVKLTLPTPDDRIVFLAETADPNDDNLELFSTSFADPENVVATGASILGSNFFLLDFDVSDDGKWFIYADDYISTNIYSTIKAVATDGSVAPFEIASAPFLTSDPPGSNVARLQLGELANADSPYIFVGYNASAPTAPAIYAVDFQPPTLPGDYNDDGVVDTADYIVWRKHVGAAPGTLPNDPFYRIIGDDQYDTWRTNLGRTASTVDDGGAVPEPTSLLLASLATILVLFQRRRCN